MGGRERGRERRERKGVGRGVKRRGSVGYSSGIIICSKVGDGGNREEERRGRERGRWEEGGVPPLPSLPPPPLPSLALSFLPSSVPLSLPNSLQ